MRRHEEWLRDEHDTRSPDSIDIDRCEPHCVVTATVAGINWIQQTAAGVGDRRPSRGAPDRRPRRRGSRVPRRAMTHTIQFVFSICIVNTANRKCSALNTLEV